MLLANIKELNKQVEKEMVGKTSLMLWQKMQLSATSNKPVFTREEIMLLADLL
jgi:hypothetical protein